MSQSRPTIGALLDAAAALGVLWVWDPERYPAGPGEDERPIMMASLGAAVDRLRAQEVRPANLLDMAAAHAVALDRNPMRAAVNAAAVLSYYANLLSAMDSVDKACQDAGRLVQIAASLIAGSVAESPYQRLSMASLGETIGDTTPLVLLEDTCPGCEACRGGDGES
jgi:hypothetical protein